MRIDRKVTQKNPYLPKFKADLVVTDEIKIKTTEREREREREM